MNQSSIHKKIVSDRAIRFDEVLTLSGLPEPILRDLIDLEVLRPVRSGDNVYVFSQSDLYRLRKMNRLRRTFDLDGVALSLVMDLLERIDYMETRLIHLERFARPDDY